MEKYIPDIYQKSIYSIDYDKLIKRGIKCILFDLDNTLVPPNIKIPNKKLQEFIIELKEKGLIIVIFSNSNKNRVESFMENLGIEGYHKTNKLFNRKLVEIMSKNSLRINEVAFIGDQISKDIYYGNNAGITTILVNPVSKNEMLFERINRKKDKKIIRNLRDKDLFLVGRYYE